MAAAWQLVVGLVYVARVRRARGRAPAVDAGFAALWIVAAVVLVHPPVLRPVAVAALDSSGLPTLLQQADSRIEVLEDLPLELWATLRGPFGWALAEEPPIDPLPLRGGGSLESQLVPAIVDLLLLWARAGTYFTCATLMCATFLFRRVASGRSAMRSLEVRVAALEALAAGAPADAARRLPPPDDPD